MRPFLQEFRGLGRHAPRVEQVLAVGRAFLATSGLAAIYLDPTEPARFAALMYALLAAYATYSVVVLALVHRLSQIRTSLGQALHAVDIVWASALTFFSEGPVSPFFLFFLFVLLAAAYRWGFRETLSTAAVTVAIFLLLTAFASVGPWSHTWFASVRFDLNSIITRAAYLLMTGFLLGYLADQEKQFRAEIAATAEVMRQPRLELGLGGSIAALSRLLLRLFHATGVDVVIQEHENARTLLWHARLGGGETPSGTPVRRIELDASHRAAWFFTAPSRTWYGEGPVEGSGMPGQAVEPQKYRTIPVTIRLPGTFTDAREFTRVAAVDFGLPGEWRGRLFLFDLSAQGSIETRLHFLQTVADHITPVLSNVFLLRRLRLRAGAAERARVARELHDGSIQALIGIEMETEALRRRAEREAPAFSTDLGHVQDLLRQEVIALRELMVELRPVDLDAPQQLPDVLATLVEKFRRDTGVAARFVGDATTATMPLRTAIELVRIAQEALMNVRKHSRARNVLVRLADRDRGWTLSVQDDGRGFDFEGALTDAQLRDRLMGPATIRERAQLVGAQLFIESAPGRGARIEVTFNAPADL